MTGLTSLIGPALFAGLVAIGTTVAIERFGGRLGGVLGTMPTTIVPASWGIWAASADVEAFHASMAAVPAGMAVDALFLWSWRVLPDRVPASTVTGRLGLMILASLGVWFAAASVAITGLNSLRSGGWPALPVGTVALLALATFGLIACLDAPPSPRGARHVRMSVLIARGLFAAIAVAGCVLIAQSGWPIAAGLASVFPAIFMTTMVSLWLSQGAAVQIGAVGPMILGSTAVGAYALVCAVAYPALGLGLGTLVSWVVAVLITSAPATWWLTGRRDATT